MSVPKGYVQVQFLKRHPKYGYSENAVGIVQKTKLDELVKGEYVKVYKTQKTPPKKPKTTK